ncbi:FecR family protein [Thalassobellus citreus]|uniref:FecR family protein n=1 Tax=Thalassobellus citreus TaxID=3367752 RepID=UPI003794897E
MKNHITKLLIGTITEQELKELNDWLAIPKNQSKLESTISDYHDLNLSMLKTNIDDAYKNVINIIEQNEASKNPVKVLPLYKRNFFKYTAVILLFISASFFFIKKDNLTDKNNTESIISKTLPGTDKATLTLEDGTTIALEKETVYQTENISSNGKEIIYNTTQNKKKDIAYNYLTIPRGGQYFLKLADGTKVWLNSETQLKYPTNFIDGETRIVELIYGEAYFDVSPSTSHNGSKFKVHNNNQDIEVLGTEFNIKAYKNENKIYTTLIEGKVAVSNITTSSVLKPNQQSILSINTNHIDITEVNVYPEISWKDGIFNFREKKLQDVVIVLMRWYNIEISFKDESLKHERFNGLIRKNQSLESILNTIKQTQTIEYEKIENKIILKIK